MDMNACLFEKLATLQRLLSRRRFAGARGAGPLADPLRGQGRILALLKMKDGLSAKDMSNVLGIRTSSLNEALAKLEAKGYVEREQSEGDKRVTVVKLTGKGRDVEQPSVGDRAAGVFDCLSDEEKQAFGDYLDRIIAELESRMGGRGVGIDELRRERREAFGSFFGERGPFPGGEGFPPFDGADGAGRHGDFGHGCFGPGGHGGQGARDGRRHPGGRGACDGSDSRETREGPGTREERDGCGARGGCGGHDGCDGRASGRRDEDVR